MGTLVVAMLMVAASAVGFGFALFGRRPVPQPATPPRATHPTPSPFRQAPQLEPETEVVDAVPTPAGAGGLVGRVAQTRRRRRALPSHDPSLSRWTRVRSALLLALTVVGLAALIGGVLSVVAVGVVLLLT